MLTVLRAGPMSSVQDAGRRGHRDSGVSVGGALDDLAASLANALVANPPGCAVLEITFCPVRIRFDQATLIGLAGAQVEAHIDGAAVATGWRAPVQAGQVLNVERMPSGMRSYLSVRGGIDVPLVLGSRSTDLRAGFGGLRGRLLQDGDRLPIGTHPEPDARLGRVGIRMPDWLPAIRVIPGPEFEEFAPAAKAALWKSDWSLTPQSDRMGCRMRGPELQRRLDYPLPSHGVLPGVIQVPPSGQPIVLVADAQTTGGYPRIGVVIRPDLWKLAQLRPGMTIRFVQCHQAEAAAAWSARRDYLETIARQLDASGP